MFHLGVQHYSLKTSAGMLAERNTNTLSESALFRQTICFWFKYRDTWLWNQNFLAKFELIALEVQEVPCLDIEIEYSHEHVAAFYRFSRILRSISLITCAKRMTTSTEINFCEILTKFEKHEALSGNFKTRFCKIEWNLEIDSLP